MVKPSLACSDWRAAGSDFTSVSSLAAADQAATPHCYTRRVVPSPVVRLLGPVAVWTDGLATSAGGPRQCAVLAVLASAVGRPVGHVRLIDAVWTDPPPTVQNTLQVYVSALRKLLRPAGLDIERTGAAYTLRASLDDVDAEVFERLAAEGRGALRAGDPATALIALEQAWGLWNPTPLAGLDDSVFAVATRAALVARSIAVGVDRVATLCAVGRADEATSAAERLVETSRYDESTWTALIGALYHAGRAREALAMCARARSVFVEELGLDPSPSLGQLELQILDHALAPTALARSSGANDARDESDTQPLIGRLPAPPAAVVGRSEAIDSTLHTLSDGARVATLTGLGGIGKTTVAIMVGHRLVEAGHTVRFADLATITTAEAAMSAMCDVIAVDGGSDPLAALSAADPDAVIVADNCEQISGFAESLASLVAATQHVVFLVTCRVPLRIRAEHAVPVAPLDTVGVDGPSEAGQLFAARARQRGSRTQLTGTEESVAEICALAGGIPLAIEMAAGRIGRLSPDALLGRLRAHPDALLDETGATDLPARQRSLRVVLDATVGLIGADALMLAERFAAAKAPVTMAMLELLMADEPLLLDVLDELVDASFVAGPDDAGRYAMPVPVREYVAERTEQLGDHRRRVVTAVLDRAESLAGRIDSGGRWAEGGMLDDGAVVRVACEIVASDGGSSTAARLANALRRYWLLGSRIVEAEQACRAFLALDHQPRERTQLQLILGQFAAILQRDDAATILTGALQQAEGHEIDQHLVVNSCCYLGSWLCDRGDLAQAQAVAARVEMLAQDGPAEVVELGRDFRAYVATRCADFAMAAELGKESLVDARRRGDRYVLIDVLYRISESLLELGRVDEAEELLDEAMELARNTEIGPLAAKVLQMRALVDLEAGHLSTAAGVALTALRLASTVFPDPLTLANSLRILAGVWFEAGERPIAAKCDGAAAAILRRAGAPADSGAVGSLRTRLAIMRSDARARSLAAAAGVDPDAVVREVLGRTAG